MSSSINNEYDQKGELDGLTSTFGFQNSRGTRDKLSEGESLNKESGDSEYVPEIEVDVEDLQTSDEEWAVVRVKGSGRIDNAEQVSKQDMTTNKSTIGDIEQTQLGSSFHSDYETSKAKMDTDGETDRVVPRLLRKKEKPIKSLLIATHLHRKGNGADQGNNLRFSVSQGSKEQQLLEVEEELEAGEDIPPSFRPQSMTD
ncbi:LOW QUALITY PROTEIN: hypothetical protein Cgig2_002998 [Carnegiea gigantea]|uniref:Uncharacterized protein n=1 Tax=Carnegiea gigantea TaxID=171969 RepID=A0A9Q1QDM1_9CARY|nr:LOW QUALITY PROTEIN: hypothetical protein Cgig2_002998 [Carnegiea gigantea]